MTTPPGRPLTREEAKAAADALRTLGRALIRIRDILSVTPDALRLGPGPRQQVPSPLLRAAAGIRWTAVRHGGGERSP